LAAQQLSFTAGITQQQDLQRETHAQLSQLQQLLLDSNTQRNAPRNPVASVSRNTYGVLKSKTAPSTCESDLITSMLGKVNLVGSIPNFGTPAAAAAVTPSRLSADGLVYESKNKLETLLVRAMVATKLAAGDADERDQVTAWADGMTIEDIHEALADNEKRIVNATRHDNAVATLEKLQPPQSGVLEVKLGDNLADGKVLTDFKRAMSDEFFNLDVSDSDKPFSMFVSKLGSYIELHKLSSAGAYNLARQCLRGTGLRLSHGQEQSGMNFSYFFSLLQSMGNRLGSPAAIVAEIQRIKHSTHYDMNKCIAKLQELHAQLHKGKPEADLLNSVCVGLRSDLIEIVRRQFPYLLPTILAEEKAAMLAHSIELECRTKANLSTDDLKGSWHPLQTFLNLIILHTREAKVIGGGTSDKFRKPGQAFAIKAEKDPRERNQRRRDNRSQVRPQQQQNQRQQQFREIHSMDVHTGQGGKGAYPRSPRGTYLPRGNRGGNSSRGRGDSNSGQWVARSANQTRQTRGAGRGGRGNRSNFGNRNGRNAPVSAVTDAQKGPTGPCRSCNRANHRWAQCRKYDKTRPGDRRCNCGGFHSGPCRERPSVNAVIAE